MKLLLSIYALFAISCAFMIPRDLGDGMFVHSRHNNGSSLFTTLPRALDDGTVKNITLSAKFVEPRDTPLPEGQQATCGNGNKVMYLLNAGDVKEAVKQFHFGCRASVDLGDKDSGSDVFYRSGTAVIFMCNYGGRWCKNDEFDMSFKLITDRCGEHTGHYTGFVRIWEWYKSYGLDHAKNQICR